MEREIKPFLSGYSYLQLEKSHSQPGNFPSSRLLSTSLSSYKVFYASCKPGFIFKGVT